MSSIILVLAVTNKIHENYSATYRKLGEGLPDRLSPDMWTTTPRNRDRISVPHFKPLIALVWKVFINMFTIAKSPLFIKRKADLVFPMSSEAHIRESESAVTTPEGSYALAPGFKVKCITVFEQVLSRNL